MWEWRYMIQWMEFLQVCKQKPLKRLDLAVFKKILNIFKFLYDKI